MRKTTTLGLSTIALCLGFLFGAAGNLGHGHSAIKAAHADSNTGGSGGAGMCPGGARPACMSCGPGFSCQAVCAGGLVCMQNHIDGIPVSCEITNTYCLTGTTKIGGPGSPPIGIGR